MTNLNCGYKLPSIKASLAHHPMSVSVEGPQSWTEIVNTESDGFYPYMIDISQHTTVGTYKMTVSSAYGDEKVSQEITFRVKEYVWDD